MDEQNLFDIPEDPFRFDDSDFHFTFHRPEPGSWSPGGVMEKFEEPRGSFNPIERDPQEDNLSRVSGFIEFYKELGFDEWPPESPRTDLPISHEEPLKPGGVRRPDPPFMKEEWQGPQFQQPPVFGFGKFGGGSAGVRAPDTVFCERLEEEIDISECNDECEFFGENRVCEYGKEDSEESL